MKKTYTTPEITVEEMGHILLAGSQGVQGLMDDKLEIGYGGVDETGSLDPSANRFGGWDDDSWDKL